MPPLQQMSLTDPLQRVLNSFKVFEKKLDKLQDDLNFHGHSLSEVRYMLAGITTEKMLHQGSKNSVQKSAGIQCNTVSKMHQALNARSKRKHLTESLLSTRSKSRSQKSDHSRTRVPQRYILEPVNTVMVTKRKSSPAKRVISNRTLRRLKRQALEARKSPSGNMKGNKKLQKLT